MNISQIEIKESTLSIGFIGLGMMGEPMALNLVRAGIPLIVWNRSPEKCELLHLAGATVASSPSDVFRQAKILILMLANGSVIDNILQRGTSEFETLIAHHTIIHMGTTSPDYSRGLETEILGAGGHYVEAPVSGSQKTAEMGKLVTMLAGEPGTVESIRAFLQPMSHEQFVCGPVPNALLMKLAVNTFLINMVTGLAEAFHFAEQQGLDLQKFQAVLDTGPMASQVSALKAQKLRFQDFEAQASISDVLYNNRLITEIAQKANLASPLISACQKLYEETEILGKGRLDMAAVIYALKHRSATQKHS